MRIVAASLLTVLLGGLQISAETLPPPPQGPHAISALSSVNDELVVIFRESATEDAKEALARKYGLSQIARKHRKLEKVRSRRFRIRPGERLDDQIALLRKESAVRFVEPNYSIASMGSDTPDDPLFVDQWALAVMDVPRAWGTTRGAGVIVAVIDTGVSDHPDLAGAISGEYDVIHDDDAAEDDNGHGTAIAGLIAARSNNGLGIAGVAPEASVIAIKVLDSHGAGTTADAAEGVVYAADSGARVVNLSLGTRSYSQVLQEAVDYAIGRGCVIVAAVGNDGTHEVIYPAGYAEVVGVGASRRDGTIAPDANSSSTVDFVAPGEDVLSTGSGATYTRTTGTSVSAALVSGVAALILADDPALSSTAAVRKLVRSAVDEGDPGRDDTWGYGRIDADAALRSPVKPFHELAITAFRLVEDGATEGWLAVDVANLGTFATEACTVALYESEAAGAQPIATFDQVVVQKRTTLRYLWRPVTAGEIHLTARLTPARDTSGENNTKQLQLRVRQDGSTFRLYANIPPVHGWIAFQAYNKLASGALKTELANYVATSSSSSYYSMTSPPAGWDANSDAPDTANTYALLEGAWEEDVGTRPEHHFWNPDSSYDDGILYYDSALELAQAALDSAVAAYPSNKKLAYWWLGRAAHITADMSVPAHTHLDSHLSTILNYGDQYEAWTAASSHYKNITSSSSNTGIPSPSYTPALWMPSGYDATLSWLLFDLAQYSQQYDSDDVNGDTTSYGAGKFRFARVALPAGKTVSRVEYWGVFSKIRTLSSGSDYSIYQNSCEYRLYLYQTFYDTINNTSNRVRVYYSDGSDESFYNLDENLLNDVWAEPIQCVYQPALEARAIGYVAALYQRFWERVPKTCTSFSISPGSANPTYASGSTPVTITGSPSGCQGGSWTASGNGSWITVSPTSGSGSGSTTVYWSQNASTSPRSGSATVAGNSFNVNQGAAPPQVCTTFSINPSSANPSYLSGSVNVTVTGVAPSGCQGGTWTASGNGSWITVSPASGTGSGSTTVYWSQNGSTSSRSGTATIAGNSFNVNQGGAPPPACSLFTISPTSANPSAAAGWVNVTITGSPTGCQSTWTTSGDGSWITVSPASGSGSGSATVYWTQNPSTSPRSSSATVAGNSFPVTQSGTVPPTCTSFSISPLSASATAAAGSTSVSIIGSPAACQGGSWTASGNGSWVTVSPASGTGPGSTTVYWSQNTSTSPRSGNATIASNTFPVTQAGGTSSDCSFAVSPTTIAAGAAAGSQTVTITVSPAECTGNTWTAIGNSWISVSPTSGSGSGSVIVSWTTNGDTARSGTATIAGQQVTVNQNGGGTCGVLSSGVPVTGLSDSTIDAFSRCFTIVVPAGATALTVSTTGGTGDVDLYVRKDALPTVATYDCRPFYWGNEEGCTFSAPSPGTWYIGLYTWDPYTGVTLTATVTGGGPSSGTLFNLISPCRVIDSRATTALEAGGTRTIAIGGSCGIPADAVAVAANITAVTPAQDGWFALYRAGTAWSGTSTLNFRRNRTRANSAILPLSQDGKVEIRNGGIAATQFIIDVSGYFR